MAVSYRDIRTDRQWKASTGLSKQQFFSFVPLFKKTYEALFDESLEDRQNMSTSESTFKTYADLLFFGLYSFKSGLTYDLLGLTFGLSNSNAYQNQSIVIRVLESTLDEAGYLPKRSFSNEDELKAFLSKETTLLIDATEQRVQRPDNEQEQRSDYSGKKNRTR
ncbi:MAG: hypothetical protein AAFY76_20370 [Cyanobacteria bacterium J06649_11]